RDALVERVRARLKDVLPRRWRLRRRHRLERRIEDRLAQVADFLFHRVGGGERRQVGRGRLERARRLRLHRGVLQVFDRERGKEFLGGGFVVVAAIGPEEERVFAELSERGGRDAVVVGHDALEQALFLKSITRELVVDDRVDGDRRLRQPVRQLLLPGGQRRKAGRLNLEEAGVADALDERRLPRDFAR